MATCSLPAPRHSLSATGWSQPVNLAAEGGLSSPPDIWIPAFLLRRMVEEGGMLREAGERGEDRRSARYHIYSILSPQ